MTTVSNTNEHRKPLGWLPYVLAGLSFIPLLGVPIGLITIIWGIWKRREGGWKVAVIGLCGTLVTIVLCGHLFYLAFAHRGVYDEKLQALKKECITALAKDIEFYKMANGHYPESLTALEKTMKKDDLDRIHLYDYQIPLFGSSGLPPLPYEQTFFYYQLQPDHEHYYLLSVGPDGKPFTKDDVTPEFPSKELSHMGLLIHK